MEAIQSGYGQELPSIRLFLVIAASLLLLRTKSIHHLYQNKEDVVQISIGSIIFEQQLFIHIM